MIGKHQFIQLQNNKLHGVPKKYGVELLAITSSLVNPSWKFFHCQKQIWIVIAFVNQMKSTLCSGYISSSFFMRCVQTAWFTRSQFLHTMLLKTFQTKIIMDNTEHRWISISGAWNDGSVVIAKSSTPHFLLCNCKRIRTVFLSTSVRLSNACIVTKRNNSLSIFQHRTIEQCF